MKIALAQMKIEDDMDYNYHKSIDLVKQAKENECDLIIFPEIQLSPFFPQYPGRNADKYLISTDSKYVRGFCEACRKYSIYASPNFYIMENNNKYDMNLLIDDKGSIIGKQKMVHIAQCDKFYEQDYYTPSEEGFEVFETELGKIGIVVCFDRHYPESIRTLALRGAQLILIPTANTTAEPDEIFEWEIKIQSFHNSVNIAMCNRVGREDKMNFNGKSLVTDYNADIIAKASEKEQLLIADVNMQSATKTRNNRPYTNLRKTEFYE